ncbi:MAG: hypothetical protein JO144_14935 [Actinobacteria bacterium]|nr:hypothetical protein [Actinomycetota bacterium]
MYFRNRRDQEWLDELRSLAAAARARAEQATDPRERARQLAIARRMDHFYRTNRAFPIGMSLLGLGACAVLAPWAVLNRHHHPVPGLVLSGVVLIVVLALEIRGRRRRRARRAQARSEVAAAGR